MVARSVAAGAGGGRFDPPARAVPPAGGRRVRVGRFEYYEDLPPLCWHSVCLVSIAFFSLVYTIAADWVA